MKVGVVPVTPRTASMRARIRQMADGFADLGLVQRGAMRRFGFGGGFDTERHLQHPAAATVGRERPGSIAASRLNGHQPPIQHFGDGIELHAPPVNQLGSLRSPLILPRLSDRRKVAEDPAREALPAREQPGSFVVAGQKVSGVQREQPLSDAHEVGICDVPTAIAQQGVGALMGAFKGPRVDPAQALVECQPSLVQPDRLVPAEQLSQPARALPPLGAWPA